MQTKRESERERERWEQRLGNADGNEVGHQVENENCQCRCCQVTQKEWRPAQQYQTQEVE